MVKAQSAKLPSRDKGPTLPVVEAVGQDLVDSGVITADQLAVAKETQKSFGGNIGEVLLSRGFVTEKDLLKAVSKRVGVPAVSLETYAVDPEAVKMLPASYAKKWNIIPIFKVENNVTVATADPLNLEALDDVRDIMKTQVTAVLASPKEIEDAINVYYKSTTLTESTSKVDIEVLKYEGEEEETSEEGVSVAKLEREASGEKIVSTVNNILVRAFQEHASDIHLEPNRLGLRVRFRIDGVLEEIQILPKRMHLPTVSRVKIMASVDVAERRIPQDGRTRVRIGDAEVDLRINTYPTMFGEAAAIRLLSKENLMTMNDLGFFDEDQAIFTELMNKPHGMFLVTGPTGSGKSTTLYAGLLALDRTDKHVLSIEDPVENEIEGVDQTQVNVKAGMTFPTALRAMLRQDPDVIMVGEIRDSETAEIATRAAMTGHLVLSTLHTNTAVSAISRMVDLGVEPYLIASTLLGVMAQRLVRKICQNCIRPATIPEHLAKLLGPGGLGLKGFEGAGCKQCRMSGFQGRIGIFELFKVDDEIRVLINNRAQEVRIREKMGATPSYHSLVGDGIEKIKKGITTVDEVLRVIQGI